MPILLHRDVHVYVNIFSVCPPDFRVVGIACYLIVDSKVTRQDAMQSCEAKASYLIKFDNEEEQYTIEQLGEDCANIIK